MDGLKKHDQPTWALNYGSGAPSRMPTNRCSRHSGCDVIVTIHAQSTCICSGTYLYLGALPWLEIGWADVCFTPSSELRSSVR